MALDELLQTVAKEAQSQARDILTDARGEASRLIREAEERIGNELDTRLKESAAELHRIAARHIGAARRESQALELQARERFFDRVFAAIRKQLGSRQVAEALATNLAPRLERLLAYLPDRPLSIHCAPEMHSAVTAALTDLEGIAVEGDASSPGTLRLEAGGGTVSIDDSLERRLESMWPELRIELAREVPNEP